MENLVMQNVGTPDRIIRAIVGAALVGLPFLVTFPVWAFWTSLVAGAVFIATAVFSFCPIYAALGLSSQRRARTRPPGAYAYGLKYRSRAFTCTIFFSGRM
jgi:hypothetical protein